jgi:toxin ParE1/3/4
LAAWSENIGSWPERLEISPLAETDMEAIAEYIALDSPGNALRFIENLRQQCRKITKALTAYVARPELGDGIRSCAYDRHVIFFRPGEVLVRIERILHSALDIKSELIP